MDLLPLQPALRIRLPWPPSVNRYWRTRVVGKVPMVYLSPEGRQYRRDVEAEIYATIGRPNCFDGPLRLSMRFTAPDNRTRDGDNLQKALWDSLIHVGLIRDDSQFRQWSGEFAGVEKPGWVEIDITPI